MKNFFKRIGKTLSAGQREDYEKAVTRIVAAIDSGQLKNTDKASLATPVIDAGQPGWLSPLDGIDWVELHAFADEHKMPLETVDDVLTLLRIAIGKM
jgi:hypothetical protein